MGTKNNTLQKNKDPSRGSIFFSKIGSWGSIFFEKYGLICHDRNFEHGLIVGMKRNKEQIFSTRWAVAILELSVAAYS